MPRLQLLGQVQSDLPPTGGSWVAALRLGVCILGLGPTMGGYLPRVGAMMPSRTRIVSGAGKALVAGAVGVAVMTLGEVEQVFTHRPSSFVPAHTLERLLGLASKTDLPRRGLHVALRVGMVHA